MSDPYADWLDIPANLRPPTHYQLLGIPSSELDPRAISAAANRRLARLREHSQGPRGEEVRRIAREVVEARDTLIDPVTRLTYDTLSPDAADPWWKEEAAPPAMAETAPVEGWWQGETPDADITPPPPAPPVSVAVPDLLPIVLEPVPPPLPARANDWWRAPDPGPVASPPPPARSEPPPLRTPEPPPPLPAPIQPAVPVIREQALAYTTAEQGGSPIKWIFLGLFVVGLVGGGAIYFLRPPSVDPPPDDKHVAENNSKGELSPPVVDPPDKEDPRLRPKPPNDKGITTVPKPSPKTGNGDPEDPPQKKEPMPSPAPDDVVRPVTLRGHKGGSAYGVAVSSDGQTILSISDDRSVLTHSRVEPGKARSLHRLMSPGLAVVLCNDDKYAVFCDGGDAVVYDLAGGGIRVTFENPRGGIRSLAAVPDGSLILTGTTDGAVRIWNTKSKALDNMLDVDDKATVTAVAVAPDGRTVVLGLSDGRLAIWDLKSRRETKRWKGHTGAVTAVSVSPDGKRFVSAGDDGIANVWQPGGTLARKLQGHVGPLAAAVWCSDNKRVVTAGVDKTARMWVEDTGWKADWSGKLGDRAFSLAVDSRDRFAAVGLGDGAVQILPLPPGK